MQDWSVDEIIPVDDFSIEIVFPDDAPLAESFRNVRIFN